MIIHHLAALGIDGHDDVPLRLIGKAAQRSKRSCYDRGCIAGAVMHGAAPNDVLQCHGIVVDIKIVTAAGTGDQRNGLIINLRLGERFLSSKEGAAVILGNLQPRLIEQRAAACAVAVIGAVQAVTNIIDRRVGGGSSAPVDERLHRTGLAGEHIRAIGLSAGVACHSRDHGRGLYVRIGFARFIIAAQQTQRCGVAPTGRCHHSHQTQQQRQTQDQRRTSPQQFHISAPQLYLRFRIRTT